MEAALGASARLESRHGASWWSGVGFAHHPEIVHGVTHASLGNFSLAVGDDDAEVQRRRTDLLSAAGFGYVISPMTDVWGARIGDSIPSGRRVAMVGSFSLTTCLAL